MKRSLRKSVFLTAVAALCFLLVGCGSSSQVNAPDTATGLEVPEPLRLYSGDGIGYSFLYPSSLKAGEEEGSACIYGSDAGMLPYVLVSRTDRKNLNAEKYFKECDKLMLDTFDQVSSTPVHEVKVGDKTLYLTRYQVKKGQDSLVIDRYAEFYPVCAIEYTAISQEPGSLDTIVYYAVSTLKVQDGAYSGAFSTDTIRHTDEELGLSMDLPEMLRTQELTIGTFSVNDNAVLLCVICNEDNDKKPIYNRQDFMDRAKSDEAFVASFLGADSAEFSDGKVITLGGKDFYCYPMKMTSEGENYQGVLALANANETGVVVLCYAVRDGCPEHDRLVRLLEDCIESVDFSK